MVKPKVDEEALVAALKRIEKEHPFKVTARCTDGSAFLLPVLNGVAVGVPFCMTPAKILKLAAIGPMKK